MGAIAEHLPQHPAVELVAAGTIYCLLVNTESRWQNWGQQLLNCIKQPLVMRVHELHKWLASG